MLFVTCAEYNRWRRPYSEMLPYKPLTNNALRCFKNRLSKKLKIKVSNNLHIISKITIARLYTGGTGTESMCGALVS